MRCRHGKIFLKEAWSSRLWIYGSSHSCDMLHKRAGDRRKLVFVDRLLCQHVSTLPFSVEFVIENEENKKVRQQVGKVLQTIADCNRQMKGFEINTLFLSYWKPWLYSNLFCCSNGNKAERIDATGKQDWLSHYLIYVRIAGPRRHEPYVWGLLSPSLEKLLSLETK